MPAQRFHPPAWWGTFFKNRQFDVPMAGIDAMSFIMVIMRSMMVIAILLELEHLFAAPRAPEHPEGNRDDHR